MTVRTGLVAAAAVGRDQDQVRRRVRRVVLRVVPAAGLVRRSRVTADRDRTVADEDGAAADGCLPADRPDMDGLMR